MQIEMRAEELRFSVKPSNVENSVAIFSYALPDDRGVSRLTGVRWNSDAASRFKLVCLNEVPAEIEYHRGSVPAEMMPWVKVGCTVKDISEINLSFEQFWGLYGKKVGNKTRCQKKWEKLTEEEKIMSIGVIRRMRAYYDKRGIEMPYPETFIDQRRWENLFE